MKYDRVNRDQWINLLPQFKNVCFYQSPSWFELWAEFYQCDFGAFLIEFRSGKKVLFPYLYKRLNKGFSKSHFSSPEYGYGGFLKSEDLSISECDQIRNFLKTLKSFNIYDPDIAHTSIYRDQITKHRKVYQVHLVSSEKFNTKISDAHRQNIQKAISEKMVVLGSNLKSDWQDFHELQWLSSTSRKQKKLRSYPIELFHQLSRLPEKHCRLWLVKQEGVTIAGTICFYYNKRVEFWFGSLLFHHEYIGANQLLHYRIMEHAIKNGYDTCDFGPAPKSKSERKFCRAFGAQEQVAVQVLKMTFLQSFFPSSFE